MKFSIRCMRKADIDEVYAIESEVHISPWSKEILRDCVLVGYDCRVLELSKGENLVLGGYIICRYSNTCCHILNLCIAKPLQARGYGSLLLQDLLDSLNKSLQIDNIVLEVRPSNSAALRLYQRKGFEQTEIKQGYYIDNDKVEDAILLKKILVSSL